MENKNEKIDNDKDVSNSSVVSETMFSDEPRKDLINDTSINKDLQDAKEEKDETEGNPIKNISNNINAESNNIEKKMFSNKVESTFPSGGKKKKDFGLYIIGFVFLLILVGIAAYYFVFNERKDTTAPEDIIYSQQIIKSSFEAMSGVESYNFNGRFDVDIKTESKDGEISENLIKMNISGSEDGRDENYPKASYNFEMDSDFEVNQKRTSFFVDLSVMSFGEKEETEIYMNLKDLDSKALESNLEIQIDSFKNKWYELRVKDLKDMGIGKELFEALDDSEKSKFDIKSIYEKYNFFKFKSDLGDAKLGDVDVYHYSVEADSDTFVDFYIELIREGILLQEKGEAPFNGSAMRSFEEAISKFEENYKYRELIKDFVKQVEIEMWIGKDDNLVYKIKVDLEMNEDFLGEMEKKVSKIEGVSGGNTINSSEDKFSFSMNIELNMSEFNQSLNIEKPKDYENLIMVLMKSFMSGSSSSVDSDGDGLTDDMEAVYRTDVNNPDTDGDGFNDGDEIDGGYDPLTPGAAKFNVDDFLGAR